MRLAEATLDRLAPSIATPGYDRTKQAAGIVHLGIGAFHRAHQAVYTDHVMTAGDRDWAITGVSLRSSGVRDQLVPQDGLYTVTERAGADVSRRLIGAVRDVLVAREDPEAVVHSIADAATRIVTLTVTEKGYRTAPAGTAGPGSSPEALSDQPGTIYDYLCLAIARRRAAGLPGLTLLSCDNLADNGQLLSRNLAEALDHVDPALARWFNAECACPSSMIDRIVPATTPEDLDEVERAIGLRDEGAVITEPFSQWVIEDRFAGLRPRWDIAGAQFVGDVRAFETAKLRMLNGAHSALAYLGLEQGHNFVHEAIADSHVRPLIVRLMREDAAPTVPSSVDSAAYADMLLTRFANSGLPHRLRQIAMDGSQKIPQRWLHTLADQQRQGRRCDAILEAIAAWMLYVRGDRGLVDDPWAERLATLWRDKGSGAIAETLFGAQGIFAEHWRADVEDLDFMTRRLQATQG